MKTKENRTSNSVKSNNSFFATKSSGGFFVQPKLNVGQPGDKYEQEADRVADQVMAQTDVAKPFFSAAPIVQNKKIAETITPLLQRAEEAQAKLIQCAEEEEAQTKLEVQKQEEEEEEAQPKLEVQLQEEEEEMMQMQVEEEEEMLQTQVEEEEEPIQAKTGQTNFAKNNSTEHLLKSSRGTGSLMNSDIRAEMEQGFGADFSAVKVHTNSTAVQMNKDLGAQAFTSGNDVYFNEGKYVPNSQSGKRLLAHELTHTVQQGASQSQTTVQREITASTSPSKEKAIEESNMCDEIVEREKNKFINHGKYGPQTSPKGYGSFDATYFPTAETLDITVRGKTHFTDGLDVSGANVTVAKDSDLNDLASILNVINDASFTNNIVNNYYTWSLAQKTEATQNFKLRLAEAIKIWENKGKYGFYVDKPCWKDIMAYVNINLNVQQAGEANLKNKDHLQVTLVKNPKKKETKKVSDLVKAKIKKVQEERQQSLAINPDADLYTTSNVASRGEMTLTNRSLRNTPNERNNFNRSMLRNHVLFKNNEWVLDSDDKMDIDSFLKAYKNVDGNKNNSKISLIGHASTPGSTSYNRKLVDKRLDSVYKYLKDKGATNIAKRTEMTNKADGLAEKYDPSNKLAKYLRRVELVVGSGELQNTVAHEFGHVFEMDDEYVTPAGESGSGEVMGTEITTNSKMSKDIGAKAVVAEDNDNIMSVGNEVRRQHYGAFGMMLNKITGKSWKIF